MNSHSLSEPEKYEAAINFIQISGRVIPALFILAIIAFIHITVFTHRICGPVISFDKAIKQFRQGNLKARIKLRKKDFLKEQSESVNEILNDFADYISGLEKSIENLEEKAEKNPELLKEIDKLKTRLRYIKI
jgi:methyl-accepting chemotaxis protein